MSDVMPDAKRIFLDALEKESQEERARHLDEACHGEAELRGRVEQLLQAHQNAGKFLGGSAISDPTIDQPPPERPGTTIGPYKLRELVGEGGMGVVYVAEQSHPVRRKVALKVIKPGMDTKQVVARFEAERQALAMMDHPNIAKVHDGGTTESGRPYFVMELVPGVPITEYCDGERLSVPQRLELFVLVCRAVQHAHQKGIIHRDLKPSNILVTLHDGVPVPKVIDFGVAKAMGQSLTEKTVYTALAQLVGTPLYMSPEQAEMNQLGVDTRSDVYSLGVLLYELLTGTTPFDKEALGGSGLEEMRRMIREDEPPRPSARVSSLGPEALSTTSQRRSTDPRRISAALHGELDWIVMKALEKDRSRRYESASALATDIQRYLDDEPVLAGPPSTMYKFHKLARKHRAALATAVAIAASLILGTTASAWQAVRATTAEAEANANATQAQEKAQEANAQRDEAQRQRDEVRTLLYAANMNLAQHAWEAGDIRRVRELLRRHRPKAGESDLRGFEWYYLDRLCHAELLTFRSSAEGGWDLAYSPDGKRLASAHRSGVTVWDAQTGRELLALKGAARVVAFSPDGKRLASGSGGFMSFPFKEEVPVEVKVWDAQTGQELTTFKGDTGAVYSVAFSPDGKRLAAGSGTWDDTKRAYVSGEVKVRDVQTGQELLVLKHTGSVSVAYSPDGKRLASAGQKPGQGAVVGEVKVWDAETGQEVFTVDAPAYSDYHQRTIAYSPDGKRLTNVSVSKNGAGSTMTMWDAQTGRELLTQKTDGKVGSIAFSPNGKRLVTGAGWVSTGPALIDRAVRVWDAETGEELYSLKGHAHQVQSVAFSPDGSRLASASRDGTLKVWDATTSQEARAVPGGILSPDGKHLAGSVGNEVKVWDTQTGRETLTLTGHMGRVQSVAFSPDGRRLVSAAADRTVKLWDAQTGQELRTFKGLAGPVDAREYLRGNRPKDGEASTGPVAFSPDGRRVASGNSFAVGTGPRTAWTTEVNVWDAQTGREVVTYKGNVGRIDGLAYSPDGKRLASAANNSPFPGGGIKVWDAETGQEFCTLPAGRTKVAFSPDGRRIAGGGKRPIGSPAGPAGSGEVKVWDAQTGRELLTLQGHTSDVWNVAFSPDGQRLASDGGGEVRVWDAQTGQQLLVLDEEGRGSYLAFSRDGHWLVAERQLWDATPLPEEPQANDKAP
jgi:WD40 repeat protein/serine/threonine protein kinase